MIYLDLRPGVTLSLLLAAAATVRQEGGAVSPRAAQAIRVGGPLAAHWKKALSEPSPEGMVKTLHSLTRDLAPLTVAEALTAIPDPASGMAATVTRSGSDSLDPFAFSAYILLTLLLRLPGDAVRLLIPRIGSDSSEQVFRILKDSGMLISPTAPALSPWTAAVLAGHFTPFATVTPSAGWQGMTDIADPLDPDARARAFHFAETLPAADTVAVIQANIDDMTPELLAGAARVLGESGALDVVITPVVMKKGRPGQQVEVLTRPEDRIKMEELLLRQTTTFGVRSWLSERKVLERRLEECQTSHGRIRVKRGYWKGVCLRSVPEYEDVAALSAKIGIPLLQLYTDIQNEIARQSP